MTYAIENCQLDDTTLKSLVDLYIATFNAPDKEENWDISSASIYFKERINEESTFFVIRSPDGSLIAAACGSNILNSFIQNDLDDHVIDRCFYISLIVVDKHFQGHGIGRRMLQKIFDYCRQSNYASILVRCRSSNEPMKHILNSEGFFPLKTYRSELGAVNCERVLFIKSVL